MAQLDTPRRRNATRVWRKVAAAGDAGTAVRVTLGSSPRPASMVAAYRGVARQRPGRRVRQGHRHDQFGTRVTPVATVSGPQSWGVRTGCTATRVHLALGPGRREGDHPGGRRHTGGGRVTGLLADTGRARCRPAPTAGSTATAAAASTTTTTWTVILARRPESAGTACREGQADRRRHRPRRHGVSGRSRGGRGGGHSRTVINMVDAEGTPFGEAVERGTRRREGRRGAARGCTR